MIPGRAPYQPESAVKDLPFLKVCANLISQLEDPVQRPSLGSLVFGNFLHYTLPHDTESAASHT